MCNLEAEAATQKGRRGAAGISCGGNKIAVPICGLDTEAGLSR